VAHQHQYGGVAHQHQYVGVAHQYTYHAVFNVSKEVSKVDVEKVSRGGHHDVVIVAITNTLGVEGGSCKVSCKDETFALD